MYKRQFQCFALIQLLTSGGPKHATDTIMYYIYNTAFKMYRYVYGNAMGVILAIMIAVLSAVQFKVTQSNEDVSKRHPYNGGPVRPQIHPALRQG